MHVQTTRARPGTSGRQGAGTVLPKPAPVSRRRIDAAIATLRELVDEPELSGAARGGINGVVEALGHVAERAKVTELAAARRRREEARAEQAAERKRVERDRAERPAAPTTPGAPIVAAGQAAGGEALVRQLPTAAARMPLPPAARLPAASGELGRPVAVAAAPARTRTAASARAPVVRTSGPDRPMPTGPRRLGHRPGPVPLVALLLAALIGVVVADTAAGGFRGALAVAVPLVAGLAAAGLGAITATCRGRSPRTRWRRRRPPGG